MSLSHKIDTAKCITNKRIKEITIKEKYEGKYIEVIHVYEEDDKEKADLNASLNMIRKSKPNALWTGFKGWNTPKRTNLLS